MRLLEKEPEPATNSGSGVLRCAAMPSVSALQRPFESRWLRASVLGVFAAQFVVLGACLEGLKPYVVQPALLLSAMQSILLWLLLALPSARSRLWRAVVSAAVASMLVLQTLFHHRYGTFIDAEVIRSTIRFWADVKPELVVFAPRILLMTVGVAVAEYAWLSLSCKNAPGSH